MQEETAAEIVEEYQLSTVKIADLKLDPSNPNKPTKEQIAGIRQSIKEFGFVKPLVINENMEIADGEHRALVMKALGKTEIQAYIVPVLNDDIKRRLARQTLNKLQGEHDIKLDADEMALIFQAGKLDNLAELIAQERESLENILTKHKGIQFQHEDNFDVDKALEDLVPETKLGDIWQLGQHRIVCGDCSDDKLIAKLMEEKKADMVFTDPPYGVDYSSKNEFLNLYDKGNHIQEDIQNDKIEDYLEFYSNFLKTLPLNETNSIYITIADKQLYSLLQALQDEKYYFSQLLVWVKNNHVLGRTDYANKHELIVYCWKGKHEYYGDFDTTVWEIDKPLSSRLHPTMKPIELITRAIRNSSKQESIIFDPFLGSGSTLIACEQTNRICYGVEIDPHYCDVVVKRWEAFTNRKAAKLQ